MKFAFTGLAIVFTLFSFNSQAQINKGQKMLGASLTFSSSKTEYVGNTTIKPTNLLIQPSIGFGIGKNWIVGGLIGYNHTNQKQETEGRTEDEVTKINIYSVGVWARKFYPLMEKFGIYGQGNLSAGFGKGKKTSYISSFTGKADINAFAANLQPGFYFLPGKKVILEATFGSLGYSSTEQDYEEDTSYYDQKTSDFKFSVTEGLSLGVKFIL